MIKTRRVSFKDARFARFSSPEGRTKTAVGASRQFGWISFHIPTGDTQFAKMCRPPGYQNVQHRSG
jgi:hypothetical protein